MKYEGAEVHKSVGRMMTFDSIALLNLITILTRDLPVITITIIRTVKPPSLSQFFSMPHFELTERTIFIDFRSTLAALW